ncbi:MAG: serine/threonine protein kinase [Cyanobacteria bacterium SW_9_44_58]|nr:MAG: serine/threonine protein kinase [Cyanobacteria bacterium SW_9_44_58]
MDKLRLNTLISQINTELRPQLKLESVDPHNPVAVHYCPSPWEKIGAGNYAAVFSHPDYPEVVIKLYAPGRPGFEEEREVYQRLGKHPAYSQCFYAEDNCLILKRLQGVTLYDSINRGLKIPKQVIQDIDAALDYARGQGLLPHDVHGRNVMMYQGRGYVVDVSDFLKLESCSAWENLKTAYYWLYRPILAPLNLRIPYLLLDGVRSSYRMSRSLLDLKRDRQT